MISLSDISPLLRKQQYSAWSIKYLLLDLNETKRETLTELDMKSQQFQYSVNILRQKLMSLAQINVTTYGT